MGKWESDAYLKAGVFLEELKKASPMLTRQQFTTLKGQALAGDIEGARQGLGKIIGREIKRT